VGGVKICVVGGCCSAAVEGGWVRHWVGGKGGTDRLRWSAPAAIRLPPSFAAALLPAPLATAG
jgi:hypothetical protein